MLDCVRMSGDERSGAVFCGATALWRRKLLCSFAFRARCFGSRLLPSFGFGAPRQRNLGFATVGRATGGRVRMRFPVGGVSARVCL